ncbi:hypothetical protein D3C71_1979120 [compost metagenome]
MPAAVVSRQIAVDQLRNKISLPNAPVDQQVFHQEAGDDHSQAVVHPPRFVELPHRRIDNWIARLAVLPCL